MFFSPAHVALVEVIHQQAQSRQDLHASHINFNNKLNSLLSHVCYGETWAVICIQEKMRELNI